MNSFLLEDGLQEIAPICEKLASNDNIITEHNVHKHKNSQIRAIVNSWVKKLLLEGSMLKHHEHITAFMKELDAGKKGIILAEHYSNLDLPILLYLMEHSGEDGKRLSALTVAMAGMKLTEDDPRIAALTEGYERIVIYPARSLTSIPDAEKLAAEQKRSRVINRAAMKAMDQARQAGKVILVFPSGTRYREGQPETKRGVREIDSYIKSSDVMLLVSINGNCLRISDSASNMAADIICQDKVIMEISPVIDCMEFRDAARKKCATEVCDKKQMVADCIMEKLELMHNRNS